MAKKTIFGRIQRALGKGQYKNAIQEVQDALRNDPNDMRLLHKLGDLYAKAGHTPQAIEAYIKVAETYIQQSFSQRAVAVFKQVLKLDESRLDVKQRLADVYLELDRRIDALDLYHQLAEAYEEQNLIQKTIRAYRSMVHAAPDNIPVRVKLAELHLSTGASEEATQEFLQALGQLEELERWEDYTKVAERLLFIDSENLHALKRLADIYLQQGEVMKAVSKLQQAFKLDRHDPTTLELLAESFHSLGQTAKTISVLQELAVVYQNNGARAEALETYQKILELDPGNGAAQQGIAAVEAMPEAAPAPPPDDAPAPSTKTTNIEDLEELISEAEVYLKYGLAHRVQETLDKVLSINPGHPRARRLNADLMRTQGQHQEAAQELLSLVEELTYEEDIKECLNMVLELEGIDPALLELAQQKLAPYQPAPPPAPAPEPQAPPAQEEVFIASQDSLEEIDEIDVDFVSMESLDAIPQAETPPPPAAPDTPPVPSHAPPAYDDFSQSTAAQQDFTPDDLPAAAPDFGQVPAPPMEMMPPPADPPGMQNFAPPAHNPAGYGGFEPPPDDEMTFLDTRAHGGGPSLQAPHTPADFATPAPPAAFAQEAPAPAAFAPPATDGFGQPPAQAHSDFVTPAPPSAPTAFAPEAPAPAAFAPEAPAPAAFAPPATEGFGQPPATDAFGQPPAQAHSDFGQPPAQDFAPQSAGSATPQSSFSAAPAAPAEPVFNQPTGAFGSFSPPPSSPAPEPSLFDPVPREREPEDDAFSEYLLRRPLDVALPPSDTAHAATVTFTEFLDQPLAWETEEEESSGGGGWDNPELSDMEAAAARLQALIQAQESDDEPENQEEEEEEVLPPLEIPMPFEEASELAVVSPFAQPPPPLFALPPEPTVAQEVPVGEPAGHVPQEYDTPADEMPAATEGDEYELATPPQGLAVQAVDDIFVSFDDDEDEEVEESGFENEFEEFEDDLIIGEFDDTPFAEELDEALLYMEQEEYQYALDIYQNILAQDPDEGEALDGARRAQEGLERLQQAVKEQAEQAVMFDLDTALGFSSPTESRARKRIVDEISAFQEAVKNQIGEEEGETHFELGMAYHSMALFSQAIDAFETCLRGHYREVDCLKMIGQCYAAQGRHEETMQSYRQGLDLPQLNDSERIDLLFELGGAYEASGNAQEAIQCYHQVAAMDPGYRGVSEILQRLGG